MPTDSKGIFRHNSQVASMHSGMDKNKMKDDILSGKKMGEPEEHEEDGAKAELTDHGDGTFSTKHEGEEPVEHESIGHMHAHLSAKHGKEGEKHFHAHHDGFEAHTHSVHSGGEPEHETHDPEDKEAMHGHLDRAMGEEAQTGISDGDSSESPAGDALGY